MHIGKGRIAAQSFADRMGYGENSDKTMDGEFIAAYARDSHTAAAEFAFARSQYERVTGRQEQSDVIAYQVRQSFKPGEVTPEKANKIGYEFATRLLKGRHAFLICTHVDKSHIHNHIYWNAVDLDGSRKFRDYRSAQAVRHLSDLICAEHELSVIENPKRRGRSYNTWLGPDAKPSHRELLRAAIDAALAKKPRDFDALLALLQAEGYTVKHGKELSFGHGDFKRNIRLDTLGNGYTEPELRAVIGGQKEHRPRRRAAVRPSCPQGIIDIQRKLSEGKGEAYRRWATVENLKRMAKTKLYLDEHGLTYEDLSRRASELKEKEKELSERAKSTQSRLAEINVLKTHIVNYSKTRDVYAAYKKSGWSRAFLAEHEPDIVIHRAAKKAFDDLGIGKLPTVKSLQAEFAALLTEKQSSYAQLSVVRKELRELAVHKANYEELLSIFRDDTSNSLDRFAR